MRSSVVLGRNQAWDDASDVVQRGRTSGDELRLRTLITQIERDTLLEGERLTQQTQDSMSIAAMIAVGCCFGLFVLFAIENRRVTARKQAAERASEFKSSFLASMSHELRTPLNAVIGYSQMLQEEAEADGRVTDLQDLQKIETAGKHLLELINAVLEMSKIDAGKVELHPEIFAVPNMMHEVQELIAPMAAKNRNHVEVVIAPGVTRMYSDPVKVRQCLLNLASNAAKFTEGGRISLNVERLGDGMRPLLRFAVVDTGPGMTAEEQARLFQPFHQLESTKVRLQRLTPCRATMTASFAPASAVLLIQ
jgi:signal transduction histidine kinase